MVQITVWLNDFTVEGKKTLNYALEVGNALEREMFVELLNELFGDELWRKHLGCETAEN